MKFLGILALIIGLAIFVSSKSAIHEIEAFLVMLIGFVLLCTDAILEALYGIWKTLLARLPADAFADAPVPSSSYGSIVRDISIILALIAIAAAAILNWNRIFTVFPKLTR